MKQFAIDGALIIAVSSVIFFTNLGTARLWDRDEPRNAGCAAEMMERGDWVVPMFNDELRHQKPVLLYWLMMSAYAVMGVTEFAARFWSALLGIGTALLTYGIARRFFHASTALLAALILCSSLMFCVASRAATPDSALIFFSTLGLFFYVMGTFSSNRNGEDGVNLLIEGKWFPQNIWMVILMNVAFGLAVLTKGPVGAVLPTAIIGMFLLIQRLPPLPDEFVQRHGPLSRLATQWIRTINPIHFLKTCWSMRPLTALSVILLIAAPWYVLVGLNTDGDFTRMFLLTENLARATSVMENHAGGWWYYPATIAVGFFPWSIFIVPVVIAADRQISQKSRYSPAMLLLVCWVVVQVGLFSLAQTKLPSYITPCYPALAMLTAFCLRQWLPNLQGFQRRWMYASLSCYVLTGAMVVIGLALAAPDYFADVWWISLIGLIPILGGGLAIEFLRRSSSTGVLYATGISAVLFCLGLFGFATVAVDSTRQTQIVLNEVKAAAPDQPVATYHCLESSWVFYGQKPIFELQRGPQDPDANESLERLAFWKKKPVVSPEEFVSAHPNAMFITTDQHAQELLSRLPAAFQIVQETDLFLKKGQKLQLIRPQGPAESIAEQRKTNDRIR